MARQYEYEIVVRIYDRESGRSEPCVRNEITGCINQPDDPLAMLTDEALKDAHIKLSTLHKSIINNFFGQ